MTRHASLVTLSISAIVSFKNDYALFYFIDTPFSLFLPFHVLFFVENIQLPFLFRKFDFPFFFFLRTLTCFDRLSTYIACRVTGPRSEYYV